MHNQVRNQGAGLVRGCGNTLIAWAHTCAIILAIIPAASGFWFIPPDLASEPPQVKGGSTSDSNQGLTSSLNDIRSTFVEEVERSTFSSSVSKGGSKKKEAPYLPLFENATIKPRFSPDPMTIRGVSGGSTPAASIAGRQETLNGPCVGFMDKQPDHRLVLTNFFNYLSLKVESSQDTTLVIRGPGGSWCNDDDDGKNPGITGQWLSGTYEVWVGSYKKEEYYPYLIKITSVPLLNPAPFKP